MRTAVLRKHGRLEDWQISAASWDALTWYHSAAKLLRAPCLPAHHQDKHPTEFGSRSCHLLCCPLRL